MLPALPLPALLFLVLLLLAASAYATGVVRLRRRGDAWPLSHRVAATAGLVALAVTGLPPIADATTFPGHVVRHLLLAMVAPLALASSAPITLALRTLGPRFRRILLRLLHSRPARMVSTAPVVLLLEVGGLFAFYLTPLSAAAHRHSGLDALVHLHMFLAGYLFSWYLVGRDPRPAPVPVRIRLLVLLLAGAGHNILSKMMYAQGLPEHGGTVAERQFGAQLMFYGGDVMEVMLAVVLLSSWYVRTGRRLRPHQDDRLPLPGTGTIQN